ncbi:MAG: hypothetical protein KJZ64_06210 [Sphingomonadaceae bacterium]|nr:hypothetical protein [Sphingomonadaceae bacterium]
MSRKPPPKSDDPDFQTIQAAADAAGDQANQESADEKLRKLEERIAEIEPLLEQLQVNSQLGTKLTDYIEDLREEQRFFNRARVVVGRIVLATIIGILSLLALSIFHAKSPLLSASPIAIATFVVGLISGIALLLGSFTKGVFRSTAERHADGYLPPALEKSLELLNKVNGKG